MSWLLLVGARAFAQETRRTKKQKHKTEQPWLLGEEKRAEVDYYFIEGEKYYITNSFSKSIEAFKKTLDLDPENDASHYKMAQIYSQQEAYEQALWHAREAIKIAPKNKYYYLLLVRLQVFLGQLEEAEKTYKTLLKDVPDTEDYCFELAKLQLHRHRYREALATYDKASEYFGVTEEIVLKKQSLYLKLNKLRLAIKEGEKLMDLYPSDSKHAASVAQMMLSNDKLAQAEAFLLSKIENYPRNRSLYIYLAEAYQRQQKYEKAIEALALPFAQPAIDVRLKVRTLMGYLKSPPPSEHSQFIPLLEVLVQTHPQSFQVLALAADMYRAAKEVKKARVYYEKALAIDPSKYEAWQNLISLDMYLRDYDAALRHAQQALEFFPNQAAIYYIAGLAYANKKAYQEAIDMLNTGKDYAVSNADMTSAIYGQLGDAYNGLGKHEQSDVAYEMALKAKPDNDHVLNNYSYFLSLRKKNLQKAKRMSAQLILAFPENATYLDTHAWVLYMLKDFAGAEKHLQKASQYKPNATIIEHYGDALFQQGKVEKAVEQWKLARNMNGRAKLLDKKITQKQLFDE